MALKLNLKKDNKSTDKIYNFGNSCELIYDRQGTNKVLDYALKTVQNRLILVCPWLSKDVITEEVINKFIELLECNIRIDIGYGHTSDLKIFDKDSEYLYLMSNLQQECADIYVTNKLIELEEKWKYSALDNLIKLRDNYKEKFILRTQSTHEKYLICDNKFAMITTHNFLTSKEKSYTSIPREIGLYTPDIKIINQLITRYEGDFYHLLLEDYGIV